MRGGGACAALVPSLPFQKAYPCKAGAVGALLLATCLTAQQLPLVLTERQLDARASLARRVGASAALSRYLPLRKTSLCKPWGGGLL
jgi:hypothetical protein